LAQLNEVLLDASKYASTRVLVLAGDFNLNAPQPEISKVLAAAGFGDVVPTARVPTTPPRHLLDAGRHIDWAFVRDPIQTEAGKVLRSGKASDHYPVAFDLRLPS
jgi:endonuclease/exonuclease/phosphatase family metal-dependent hydrolase